MAKLAAVAESHVPAALCDRLPQRKRSSAAQPAGLLSLMKPSGTKSLQTITVQPRQGGWDKRGAFLFSSLVISSVLHCVPSPPLLDVFSMCHKGSPGQSALQCPLPLLFMYKHDDDSVLTFVSTRWWHLPHHSSPWWEVRKMRAARTAYELSWDIKVNQPNPLWITPKVILSPEKQKEFPCLPHSETLPSDKWHD